MGGFFFESLVYGIFVHSTITSITKFLDINCLYLKTEPTTESPAGEAESTQASPKDTKKTKKTPSKTSAKAKA